MTNHTRNDVGLGRRFIAALDRASITQCYISYYLPVSRQSVSNWAHGVCDVHADHADRIAFVTDAIEHATAAGILPNADTRAVHSILTRYGIEIGRIKGRVPR